MKISIERAALLKAVGQAQSVVERRNTIPILGNVLIEAEGDSVSFRATDLDIEVVDKAPAKVERAGATTVPAVTFHEIVRKLPDGALVNLTDDGASGRMTVEAGRSNFALATLPREDFPIMASAEYTTNFTCRAPVLRRLFDKAKFAISTEETRYYLNGVYMHVADADVRASTLKTIEAQRHREQLLYTAAGRFGRLIEPAIKPLGFDWKIGVGIVTSLAAREVIVGTLGTLYGIEGDESSPGLQEALRQDLTLGGAVALLVFFAFAMQCMSTVAMVRRETGGWKIPILQFTYMGVLAYVGAFITNQVVTWLV